MNNLKFINTRNFVMTLMILAGMTSCHKDDIKPEKKEKAMVTILSQTKEGDDDDKGILQGEISKGNGTPVANASVILYEIDTTIPLDSTTSDASGDFEMEVFNGDYFLEIIETNNTTTKTDDFTVDGNTSISIVI